MSKTRSLHHIVFATKRREMTIPEADKKELYAYILGIVRNSKCHLLRINGIGNHIHMLVDLNPTVALADLVKTVKQSSSIWMRQNPRFPMFDSWGVGYYAYSIHPDVIDACKNYIINQESHHHGVDLISEVQAIAASQGLPWHPDDWS